MDWSHKCTLQSEKPADGHSWSGGDSPKSRLQFDLIIYGLEACPSMSKKDLDKWKKTAFNSMKSAREMLETPFGSPSCWVAVGVKV